MTTQAGDRSGVAFRRRSPDKVGTATAILRATGRRIRRAPVLIAPFAVAGLVVMIADWLRRWDPILAMQAEHFEHTASIQHSVFPRGLAQTVRPVDALVHLRTPYFVGAIALELSVVLAIGLAGWITITRTLDVDPGIVSLARYQGVLSAALLVPWVLGSPSVEFGNLLFGLGALVVVLLIWIRLFLFPGFVAAGHSVIDALRQSVRETRGMQGTLFVLVLVLGVGCWGLTQIPILGGFLSTGVIALVHAISIAMILDRTEEDASDRRTEMKQPATL